MGWLVGYHRCLTDSQALKDRATQLLRSRNGGALVLTQSLFVLVLATCERILKNDDANDGYTDDDDPDDDDDAVDDYDDGDYNDDDDDHNQGRHYIGEFHNGM